VTYLRRTAAQVCVLVLLGLAGCDQIFPGDKKQILEAARKKNIAGDFQGAIKLYEAALDGTAKTAEAHYRLALIYDDKLKSPRDALHHFERYLELAPDGPFAKEAKTYRKEGELKLLTSLNRGALISQEEAVRLKNENLSLRKKIVELLAKKETLPAAPIAKGEPVQKPIPPGARTHIVEPGETLASIAAKFYKNRARWKDIQDANFYALEGTVKIKPGQKLIIP
jgi:tetratricopeptide (TPR) repeat protein